ncbi:MAG: DMT family transporter [Telmatospirillum sp.]|nr:DMT family transporter [Telmatospirillum sp.]
MSLVSPSVERPTAARSPAALAPLFCLILVGGLLGLTTTLVKLAAASGWHPLPFLFWSVLGASALLLGLAVATGAPPATERAHLRYYVMSGLISITLPNALAFLAVPHVGAGFVSLCLAFPPMLTYVLALLLGMERIRAHRCLGILSGLGGAVLLALGKGGAGSSSPVWVAAALTGPVFLAMGNIYRTRHWPAGARPLSLAPGMLTAGALLLLPMAGMVSFRPPALDGTAGGLLAAQTVVFAGAYAFHFILQKLAGPVYLSQIGSVGALLGAAFAVLVLGEAADPVLGAALALILAGVVLVNRRK